MRKYKMFLLILITCGCSLLHRTGNTKEEMRHQINAENNTKSNTELNYQKDGYQLIYKKDSSNTDHTLHLWPKGIINFSQDGKFSGQFDSIRMTGKQNKLLKTTDVSNTKERELKKIATDSRQKEKINSSGKRLTKVRFPDVKFIIILIVVVFLMVLILKKMSF